MSIQSESPHPGKPWRRTALAAVLLAGTALGGYAAGHASLAATTPSNSAEQPSNNAEQPSNNAEQQNSGTPVNPSGQNLAEQKLPDFVALVDQVKPAVVSVTTRLTPEAAQQETGQGQMQQLPFPFNQMIPQTSAGARRRGARLGLHHRRQRHDRHQQPCGEGGKERHRHPE